VGAAACSHWVVVSSSLAWAAAAMPARFMAATVDRMLILSARHLESALSSYVMHDNGHRPHRSLDQTPPLGTVPPPTPAARCRFNGTIISVGCSPSTPRSREVYGFLGTHKPGYSTLPGFMTPVGSNARLIARITSVASPSSLTR
jgi:hypothetical protein